MSGESQTERCWANLSRAERVGRALAAALVALLVAVHALALLHRVLPARATAALPAAMRPIGRRLERIAHWDMFRTMNETEQLVVQGRGWQGPWFDLANPFVRGSDLWSRFIDRRLRGFHDRLRGPRRLERFGRPYLAYLCRVGRVEHEDLREVCVVRLVPARLDDDGAVLEGPHRRIALRRLCAGAPRQGSGR